MISVIIPLYNDPRIAECLWRLYDSKFKDFEIIVVDDASTDDSPETASMFPCKIIRLEKNRGPSYARNRGAREAKGDVLFFLDSDLILLPNSLGELNKSMKAEDVVVGMYTKESGEKGFFQKYIALWKYNSRMEFCPEYITFTPGNCTAIKKELFDELGGFNTSYKKPQVEDYEFGHRIIEKGYKIKFNPKIQGKHYFPGFWKTVRNYYTRSSMWFSLFRKRKKFDTYSASKRNAVANMCAVASMVLLALTFILPPHINLASIILSYILFLLFFYLNISFFNLCSDEHRFLFTFKSVIMTYILAIPIVLGVASSVLSAMFLKDE